MAGNYEPHHPDFYPVAWSEATAKAAQLRSQINPVWVFADKGRTDVAALNRMRRLRAFRKGLEAQPQVISGAAEAFREGYELVFRRVRKRWDYDVELTFRWSEAAGIRETLEKEVLR